MSSSDKRLHFIDFTQDNDPAPASSQRQVENRSHRVTDEVNSRHLLCSNGQSRRELVKIQAMLAEALTKLRNQNSALARLENITLIISQRQDLFRTTFGPAENAAPGSAGSTTDADRAAPAADQPDANQAASTADHTHTDAADRHDADPMQSGVDPIEAVPKVTAEADQAADRSDKDHIQSGAESTDTNTAIKAVVDTVVTEAELTGSGQMHESEDVEPSKSRPRRNKRRGDGVVLPPKKRTNN
jgi:hypothetical protein